MQSIQVSRLFDGTRKVISISEITGMEGDMITMQELFTFDRLGLTPDGQVRGMFHATGVRPKFSDRLAAAGCRLRPGLFDSSLEV